MRAIVVHEGGGPEVLRLEEVPDPVPSEGQVLVRVEAAGVNHFDLTQRRDPAALGASPPYTPGVEAAGTRDDTGERVLVTGAVGTYAELVAAPLGRVWPIPQALDYSHAAALGVAYKTAWASLADGGLSRGDTLLVQAGSSGTGQAAIDIGLHLGATVYATASEAKHERLRALGAQPLAYDDDARINQLNAAVVFDPVGGAAFARSLAALAPGGRLVTPGAVESPIVSLNLWALIGKRARIIGTGGSVTNDVFERLIELAASGDLTPVVDRELPLAEAAEAHRLIEARDVFGKIVLTT
jgi:NADPH:quinone reductase-like Zn-dependent oxidoreductase